MTFLAIYTTLIIGRLLEAENTRDISKSPANNLVSNQLQLKKNLNTKKKEGGGWHDN